MFLQYFGMGGGRPLDLRKCLQGDPSVNPLVWIRDLGGEPKDMDDPWFIPPQGGPQYGGNAAEVIHVEAVGVPTSGRRDIGGGPRGGGDIFPLSPEHYRPVY